MQMEQRMRVIVNAQGNWTTIKSLKRIHQQDTSIRKIQSTLDMTNLENHLEICLLQVFFMVSNITQECHYQMVSNHSNTEIEYSGSYLKR